MAEIMTSAETAANKMYTAPHALPNVWVNYIKTNLNENVYQVMADNRVPWLIIKGMIDAEVGRPEFRIQQVADTGLPLRQRTW